MKPALHYIILRRSWTPQHGFAIGAVTAEKNQQVYFRYVSDNSASHCRPGEVKAKYSTQEAAEAAIARVLKIRMDNSAIEEARRALMKAERARENALMDALKEGSIP